MENETERKRKTELRKDNEQNKIEKERERKRKAQAREAAVKNSPLWCIAVNDDQENFKEANISEEYISSYVGSLWGKETQCVHCKAFKFKNETNFCCSKGCVTIPILPDPPKKMQKLFSKPSFINNARAYNNILAMASIGCKAPENYQGTNFKIQGKVHHSIGSLIPPGEDPPKFLQLYFYDTEEATNYRLKIMPKLSTDILSHKHHKESKLLCEIFQSSA